MRTPGKASFVVFLSFVLLTAGMVASGPQERTVVEAAATCQLHDAGALPDPACTPGSTNPAVKEYRRGCKPSPSCTIAATICKPGWATSVRPRASTTEPQKFHAMRQYGLSTAVGEAGKYEFDHLIPLELGGALDDPANMWPEPHDVIVGGKHLGSYTKDQVENALRRKVCAGTITLGAARRSVARNWTTLVP